MQSKNVILGSNARGLEPNATVIASLLRHTEGPVSVRLFSRDIPEVQLESGRLRVEVLCTPAHLRLSGRMPGHVNPGAAFDRLAAIPCCADWDRAVVLDYDQLVIGNPADWFELDLGDALLASRVSKKANLAVASQRWFGRKLPENWKDCSGYRFFFLGPVLNLKALRESDAFERLLSFQADAGTEEQIALHVACRDRIMELSDSLNLVPEWDGVPPDAKVLHFTGPRKPWRNPFVEGAQFWRAYETTWEELTCGLWLTQNDSEDTEESGAIPEILSKVGNPKGTRVLEIGGWRFDAEIGLAKTWMRTAPNDRWIKVFRTHVDPEALEQAIRRFSERLGTIASKTTVLDGNTAEVLSWLLTDDEGSQGFDSVILHAPRQREDFLTEAFMSWKLLRPGGVMIIHPVAEKPGVVGRMIFTQSLQLFSDSIADSIMETTNSYPRVMRKAGGSGRLLPQQHGSVELQANRKAVGACSLQPLPRPRIDIQRCPERTMPLDGNGIHYRILIADALVANAPHADWKEGYELCDAFRNLGHDCDVAGPGGIIPETEIPRIAGNYHLVIITENYPKASGWKWWNWADIDTPKMFWAIDTHLVDFRNWIRNAGINLLGFNNPADLDRYGVGPAFFLPYAASRRHHFSQEPLPAVRDVVFIGGMTPKRRALCLKAGAELLTAFGSDYVREMARSRICLNQPIAYDLNARFFDIPASGSFMLAAYNEHFHRLMEYREDVAAMLYTTEDHLAAKIRYYLAHEDERQVIAGSVRAYIRANHCWENRAALILDQFAPLLKHTLPPGECSLLGCASIQAPNGPRASLPASI